MSVCNNGNEYNHIPWEEWEERFVSDWRDLLGVCEDDMSPMGTS